MGRGISVGPNFAESTERNLDNQMQTRCGRNHAQRTAGIGYAAWPTSVMHHAAAPTSPPPLKSHQAACAARPIEYLYSIGEALQERNDEGILTRLLARSARLPTAAPIGDFHGQTVAGVVDREQHRFGDSGRFTAMQSARTRFTDSDP